MLSLSFDLSAEADNPLHVAICDRCQCCLTWSDIQLLDVFLFVSSCHERESGLAAESGVYARTAATASVACLKLPASFSPYNHPHIPFSPSAYFSLRVNGLSAFFLT